MKISVFAVFILSILLLASCNQPHGSGDNNNTQTTDLNDTSIPMDSNFEIKLPSIPSNEQARKIVVDYMKKMASVEWVCKSDIDFSTVVSFTSKLIYKSGTTYFGLPYVGGTAGAEIFKSALDENKVYTGSIKWNDIQGNTCSSSIYVAYTTISPNSNASNTIDMYPAANKGMIPVGDYNLDKVTDIKTSETKDVITANGQNTILEAYAALKPGDTLLSRWKSGSETLGHTRLVTSEPVIERGENGKIIARSSYILLTEQTSSFNESSNVNTTWKVDFKYTFSDLLGDYYIPITLKELADDSFVQPEITIQGLTKQDKFTNSNMLKGIINSNYVIFEAHALVYDSNGNIVSRIDRSPNSKTVHLTEVQFDNDVTKLPAGEYTFELNITIGLGEFTYERYSFTVN